MKMSCNVCNSGVLENIYRGDSEYSITSLGELIDGVTEVFYCAICHHIQKAEIQDIAEYYSEQYKILIQSDDEDQIITLPDGESVYRYDFQAAMFIEKCQLNSGGNVLEYGAAKAATLKRVSSSQKDINGFVFDVSEMYIPFWSGFISPENQATYHIPEKWYGNIDQIMSFFVLEHVCDLETVFRDFFNLLRKDGVLFFSVPNLFNNCADLIVADHCNHFTEQSIEYMLAEFGFSLDEIDARSFPAAYFVKATKYKNTWGDKILLSGREKLNIGVKATELGKYWLDLNHSLIDRLPEGEAIAIYGAGVYGRYLASLLKDRCAIVCFLDKNPFVRGEVYGIPVFPPESLPKEVKTLVVGLNPSIARNVIDKMECIDKSKLNLVFI